MITILILSKYYCDLWKFLKSNKDKRIIAEVKKLTYNFETTYNSEKLQKQKLLQGKRLSQRLNNEELLYMVNYDAI